MKVSIHHIKFLIKFLVNHIKDFFQNNSIYLFQINNLIETLKSKILHFVYKI